MLLLLSEITNHSPVCWGKKTRSWPRCWTFGTKTTFLRSGCHSKFNFLRLPLSPLAERPEALSLSDIVCGEWETSLREPTLHSWKFSDTSVSWMSISLGVGAAVGVPAALPHDGDPIVPPGEEVVKPSNTLRNFFIFFFFFFTSRRAFPGCADQSEDREEEDHSAFFVFPEFAVSSRMQDPNSLKRPRQRRCRFRQQVRTLSSLGAV